MIRIVLAVALTSALFGVALPNAERVDRERNEALAIDELEALATAAERLAAENDPVPPAETPAGTTITVDVPEPTFATEGRIQIRDDELRWVPSSGRTHTVDPSVPFRVETPIVATDRKRIRLSLVRLDGRAVVFATATVSCSAVVDEPCA